MKKLKYSKINEIDALTSKHSEYKQQLDNLLISYNKAKSSRNTKYDKLLELEMKAKLAQKSVQDQMTNIVEAKEHVKELREEMKRKKEEILKNVSAIHKDKLNIFTSTIFSILNAYCEWYGEGIAIIDNLLFQDSTEANLEQIDRPSIMSRGFTNVKNLLTNASPNKRNNDMERFIGTKTHSQASMKVDADALMEILQVIWNDLSI